MFTFILTSFKWLPAPLCSIVSAVVLFFAIFVAVSLIKAVWQIIQFVSNILGGILGKVVSFFV